MTAPDAEQLDAVLRLVREAAQVVEQAAILTTERPIARELYDALTLLRKVEVFD